MRSASSQNPVQATPSSSDPKDKPVPLRQLFVYPVMIAVSNYSSLDVLNISYQSLIPLFLAMPVEIGGVGLDPLRIGYIMGANRAFVAVFLALFADKLIRRFGERHVFLYSMSAFLLLWPLFPATSLWAKHFGLTVGVWVGIVMIGVSFLMSEMAYSNYIFLFTCHLRLTFL